ncbi:MAG: NAD-dependent DNA ligase LigA, partial [Oscillospiraceae bacterium]|nr:NAD-dependent DNA ligase LigA [Oscillospiraceae bacterium]
GFGSLQAVCKAGRLLARRFLDLDSLMHAELSTLMEIPDIGPVTAQYLLDWFAAPQSQDLIARLRAAGLSFESREEQADTRFAGKTFVLTGTLPHYTRDEASALIERCGGKTSSSVSKKTSYVLAGEAPGSKLDRARALGVPVLDEAAFQALLEA